MQNQKKAIELINQSIDLLKELKYIYAKSYLNQAINEINKTNKTNKTKKIKTNNKEYKKSTNPKLSLQMVENLINKEKNKY